MAQRHLKRIAAPKSWPIERKETTYILRPFGGAHKLEESMALGVFMKEVFHLAARQKEIKRVLNTKNVLIDGRRKKDQHDQLGLFDVLSLADIDTHYRITLSPKGKLAPITISKEESSLKPCQVVGKTLVKGKVQLNLSDGRSILVDKDGYKTGDTLVIEVPSQSIKKHLKMSKGVTIFLTGGKYKGHLGKVEDVLGKKLLYKTEAGEIAETDKRYAFVVGDTKPALAVSIKE